MNKTCFAKMREIYISNKNKIPFWHKLVACFGTILLGAILGYGSEWLEYSMHTSLTYQANYILRGLIYVFNNYSVWIFAATLIAYYSWGPFGAGIQTLSFLTSMCIGYFLPKYMHYGYNVVLQFVLWGVIALFSMFPAGLIWFSRHIQRGGSFIKTLPIAAILGEFIFTVYHCIDYYSPIPGRPAEPLKWLLMPERITQLSIYMLFIALLVFLLAKNKKERLKIAVLTIPISFVFAVPFFLMQ